MRVISLLVILCSALFLTACGGESDTNTLDPVSTSSSSGSSEQAQRAQIEITVGMPATKVTQLLGPADSIDKNSKGQEVWTYEGKRARFIYASNAGNVQALIIGGYTAEKEPADALPLTLRVTFDNGRKVIDFAFNQMPF